MKDPNSEQLKIMAKLLFPEAKPIAYFEKKYPPRNLGKNACVTRFAPSPTGFIHIGGIYAALVSKRIAQHSDGIFMLRIEDTDKKREIKNGIEEIVTSIKLFGLNPDEGYFASGISRGEYGPYKQSERVDIYASYAKYLIEKDLAYPCFCGEEELETRRKAQEIAKIPRGYYEKWAVCRNLNLEEIKQNLKLDKSFVIRMKSNVRLDEKVKYKDLIKGNVELSANYQDIILLKSDKLPTYHFAHVVDDYLMRTTHVIRGDEWLSSLPIHLQLFGMIKGKPPLYAHIPPIMKMEGDSKRKLSKRKDPEAAMHYYFEKGYPVDGVVEYLLNLANSSFQDWRMQNPCIHHSKYLFKIEKMNKSGALFDINKLNNLSKNVIACMSPIEIYNQATAWARNNDVAFAKLLEKHKNYTLSILQIEQNDSNKRKDINNWSEIKNYFGFFYDELFDQFNGGAYVFPNTLPIEDIKPILCYFCKNYNAENSKEEWLKIITEYCSGIGYAKDIKTYKGNEMKYKGHIGAPMMALRVALTGKTTTPDLYEIMKVMGTKRVNKRLRFAISYLENNIVNNYYISNEIKELLPKINCYFIDHQTTSKEYVRRRLEENYKLAQNFDSEHLVISTCLRFEIYNLGETRLNIENFYYAKGKLALRRLISLMCGLNSEIIGESEILKQINAAASTAYEEHNIGEGTYKAILNLISLSENIRKEYGITTNENYSTIGASLLEESINWKEKPTVLIIGGGYMANAFLQKINKKLEKLIWANRSVDKIKKQAETLESPNTENIIFSDLYESKKYFPIVDAVFAAIGNSPNYFTIGDIKKLNPNATIVDVSYPAAFESTNERKIINISNTYFDKLNKCILPKEHLQLAQNRIDELLNSIDI